MLADDNILDLLKQKGAEAAKKAQRAAILQPGAIGDCILTLPLAAFMKDVLQLGAIDMLGHADYVGVLPGRTCIDCVRSIDTMDLHRLFAEPPEFDLKDGDPLINTFSEYNWIATFLGGPDSNFEQNLIFTTNCSHSAEVITLGMKPPEDFSTHLTEFYIQQFIEQSDLSLDNWKLQPGKRLIEATKTDINIGKELLRQKCINFQKRLVIIHPGSGGKNKCWHIDNYLAVAQELNAKGNEVIFLLGPAELDNFSYTTVENIENTSVCLKDLSLSQVLGLLSCTDVFIGNDSGIAHLAGGLGIKTVVIFGPTKPNVYRPIGSSVITLSGDDEIFASKPSQDMQKKLLETVAT